MPPTAADAVYEALRQRIASGRCGPGERLPEETLAEQLGVSRTPVREALRRLESEGFVSFETHRGAQVTAWTADDLEDIFALRALLEGHAAARAARRITKEELATLSGLADRMQSLLEAKRFDSTKMTKLNNEFHHLVLEIAASSRLTAMLGSLVQLPLVQRTFSRYTRAALERSAHHHRELVAALAAGDPEWASAVMHSHVRAALATLQAAAAGIDQSA